MTRSTARGTGGGPGASGSLERMDPAAPVRPARRRWDLNAWLRVGLVVATVALLAIEAPLLAVLFGIPAAIALPLAVLHVACIPLATRLPRIAAVLAIAVGLAIPLFGTQAGPWPWPWAVPAMLVQLLVIAIIAARGLWIDAAAVAAGGVLSGIFVAFLVQPPSTGAIIANLVVFASLALAAVIVGMIIERLLGTRAQLLEQREVSAEEHAARLVAEEKARIARDLHDVIAHSMSIINVQALSAPVRHTGVSPEVRQEFEEIAAQARRGLTDLRGLLGVLRDDGAAPNTAPQPVIADIRIAVDQARAAGTPVSLALDEAVIAHAPAGLQLTIYRILQESISNALRHAPGAPIEIAVERAGDDALVHVENGGGEPAAAQAGGHGLIGMRERATGAGGSLDARATATGFVVRALLPLGTGDGADEEGGE